VVLECGINAEMPVLNDIGCQMIKNLPNGKLVRVNRVLNNEVLQNNPEYENFKSKILTLDFDNCEKLLLIISIIVFQKRFL